MGEVSKRDPFAPPGYPGNRRIRYGDDGSIPAGYRVAVDRAILVAYTLAFNPAFTAAFSNTVSKLSNKTLGKSAYFDAREKVIIHYAEKSKNPTVVKELKQDATAQGLRTRTS